MKAKIEGRKLSEIGDASVILNLNTAQIRQLNLLVADGRYGNTATSVAMRLFNDALLREFPRKEP